jgi:hypothetical protein
MPHSFRESGPCAEAVWSSLENHEEEPAKARYLCPVVFMAFGADRQAPVDVPARTVVGQSGQSASRDDCSSCVHSGVLMVS